jgi:2-polyprenyl-3-methyl-5-hydroxy-6-metoxy-1,4-benzoquinol methylase
MNDRLISLVDETIQEFRDFDLDPCGDSTNRPSLSPYLNYHRHEYIRTIRDVIQFAERRPVERILEIGAFFGVVSIVLSKLGYKVCASDMPEYMSMPEQKARYDRYDIETAGIRLQDYLMPFKDNCFDVIIMCEVLEHLNFNPLPLIKELNRISTDNSLLYLSLPNLAYYKKRLRFLLGKPILQPIEDYFHQLEPGSNHIVYGHWREYTGSELRDMLGKLGYDVADHYYYSVVDHFTKPTFKNRLTRSVFRVVPSFKESQVLRAIRRERTPLQFRIPDTVHEHISEL